MDVKSYTQSWYLDLNYLDSTENTRDSESISTISADEMNQIHIPTKILGNKVDLVSKLFVISCPSLLLYLDTFLRISMS